MPSTAPALTWSQTPLFAPAQSDSVQAALDAMQLAVAAHADWRVVSNALNVLEIAPVASSPVNAMRVLICGDPHSAQCSNPHNKIAGVLYVGLAPDGGTLGNALGNANPYGAVRWTGYYKCTGIITGSDPCNNTYAVASKESIGLWFHEAASDDWFGAVVGCVIDPPHNIDGEGTPGRVYGILSAGGAPLHNSFWSAAGGFLSGTSNGNTSAVNVIFRPTTPATTIRVVSTEAAGDAAPRYQTELGTRISVPVLMHMKDPPYNAVGILRQMRKIQDGRTRRIVQNNATPPVDKSLHLGAQANADSDALSFDNG